MSQIIKATYNYAGAGKIGTFSACSNGDCASGDSYFYSEEEAKNKALELASSRYGYNSLTDTLYLNGALVSEPSQPPSREERWAQIIKTARNKCYDAPTKSVYYNCDQNDANCELRQDATLIDSINPLLKKCGGTLEDTYITEPSKGQRYCDGNTVNVWNQVDKRYDSKTCKNGCNDGYCIPDKEVPPESQPPSTNPSCPDGQRYYPTTWEKITGCKDGYSMRLDEFPTGRPYCLCQKAGGDMGEGTDSLTTIGGLLKILPQLLIFMVIATIIGAFRK